MSKKCGHRIINSDDPKCRDDGGGTKRRAKASRKRTPDDTVTNITQPLKDAKQLLDILKRGVSRRISHLCEETTASIDFDLFVGPRPEALDDRDRTDFRSLRPQVFDALPYPFQLI